MRVQIPPGTGWIEVVCGCMFAGKSGEALQRVRHLLIAGRKVQAFKANIDTRYASEAIVSHNGQEMPATPIQIAEDILGLLEPTTEAVFIDEAQFMGPGLRRVCEILADRGVRVIASGLDQDYQGAPFANMAELICAAEFVTKLAAVCTVCGAPAFRSIRLSKETEQVIVGAASAYEARCRAHSR